MTTLSSVSNLQGWRAGLLWFPDPLSPRPLHETDGLLVTGQSADGIVRNMLLHARESGGERRSVDLNAIIEEALNLAYHGARAQDAFLRLCLHAKAPRGGGARAQHARLHAPVCAETVTHRRHLLRVSVIAHHRDT